MLGVDLGTGLSQEQNGILAACILVGEDKYEASKQKICQMVISSNIEKIIKYTMKILNLNTTVVRDTACACVCMC